VIDLIAEVRWRYDASRAARVFPADHLERGDVGSSTRIVTTGVSGQFDELIARLECT